VARVEQASEFPGSGRIVSEYADPQLREFFWHEYRVIYRVEEERILVVGVVHGRRRLEEIDLK
jgi:plasmid stabilization system protein ParE